MSLHAAVEPERGRPASVPDEAAEQASAALEGRVDQAPDDLTCAEDLPAQVGASIRRGLTAGGRTYGVTITTTSAEGGQRRVRHPGRRRAPRNRPAPGPTPSQGPDFPHTFTHVTHRPTGLIALGWGTPTPP
ncbi:DUF4333 domain-containing protein [Streptomyces sp. NRRL F-2890]|uniref:DUF4333 domain-containing protein n=1 Tax=Streptomyces sp. NRRL F-2890 TaxID=1463845 RepID=UPI003B63AFDE